MLKHIEKETMEENEKNDKSSDLPLFDKLPDHISCMWELPQIYEFLCFAKATLHIQNLSMYEMERMLSMPKASKQLANIMTSLLSSSMPRSKFIKIPPMPYEFWTNVLLKHKLINWLKIYQSKEHDSIKVLDAIGIEPEFWTIFPDVLATSQRNFDELNLRQRVWLLKTICDTMTHGKKSLQDEVANRYLDGEGEKILGRDRYGARYFYFPIFLDNDLRIYKHNFNNKILLNVAPIAPKLKIHTRRICSRPDRRRKKSRWKNGNLPQKQKKRRVKVDKIKSNDLKLNIKSENIDDEQTCKDHNLNVNSNTTVNLIKDIKEEDDDKETTNLFFGLKSTDIEKNDGHLHPDNVSNSSKTDDEKINEIKIITCNGGGSVGCTSNPNNGIISKSDDEKLIETKTVVDDNDDEDKSINSNGGLSDQVGLNTWMKALLTNKDCKDNIDDDENSRDSLNICSDSIKTRSKTICKREVTNFNDIMMDLGVSTFQLVADSVESLRELISSLTSQNSKVINEPVRCEMLLIKKLKTLIEFVKYKESMLKESTERARKKLMSEWKNFQEGIDDDKVDNSARHTSEWVLGSQGCPLLSCGDSLQHDENEIDNIETTHEEQDDKNHENKIKNKTETRRILRARGVSSYIEQFSSDDDSDSSHPAGWAEIVDPTTGMHLGVSTVEEDGTADDNNQSEGSGSDQDWILPGKRKPKTKRISPGKRIKSLQNRLQMTEVDFKNIETTSSLNLDNKHRKIYPKNSLNSIKIESVHSEFHIDEEIPINEPQTININTVNNNGDNNNNNNNNNNYNSRVQQNFVLHQVNTPNGPMNYVVMPNDSQSVAQSSSTSSSSSSSLSSSSSTIVSMIPQVAMPQGYYVQNPPGYFVSNSQTNNGRASLVNQQNLQSMHSVIIQQNPQPYVTSTNNYIQYQPIRMVSPISVYPTAVDQSSTVSQPIICGIGSTKVPPRIIQNRQIVPPYRPRHPVGAVIRSTIPFRGGVRPVISRRGRGKAIAPRNSTTLQNIGPTKTKVAANTKPNNTNKTTSLIVLSDSDDEIEMIIPQKNNETVTEQVKNKNSPSMQSKIVDNTRTAVETSTSDSQQSSSSTILSPQIIQRMNQGGISITPIKPKTPPLKSQSITSTQLVVVVNETGSHYALALPNGSKLILTPEQVAQIRASNGGKLVL